MSDPKGPAGSNSITVKIVAVGVLILLLMVPVALISGIVQEREGRRSQAIQEISQSWSQSQTVAGPVLVVPVRIAEKDSKGKTTYRTVLAYFLPEDLNIEGQVDTETRYRGIFKAAVFTASLSVKGSFIPPDLKPLHLDSSTPLWSEATVALGISDLRGVKDNVVVQWKDRSIALGPGTGGADFLSSGLSANVPVSPSPGKVAPIPFSFMLSLKGSQGLYFIPAGKTTAVRLQSPWEAPSFRGAFLPESREVDHSGFHAAWRVLHINRNFPQFWTGTPNGFDQSRFGLDLLIPVDHYSSTQRAVKYAILYIFFTFLAFFFVEFFTQKRLHPIQYLLVGSAVVLFYLILLSLSEHLPFAAAYVVAAMAVVGVVSGYAKGVFQQRAVTLGIAAVLALLYGFLYTLLQLEDYALLLGSLGLLFALSLIMYLTRKFDWYQLSQGDLSGT